MTIFQIKNSETLERPKSRLVEINQNNKDEDTLLNNSF